MKYIIAIGIFQALVAIILLVKSKLRSGADEILIFLVACICTHLLIKFVIFNFVADAHVQLQMNTFLGFCYGPLLYLYTRKLKEPQFVPSTKWYVFIPFLLAMMAYFSVISVLVTAPAPGYRMLDWYNKLTFWFMIPTEATYALLSLRMAGKIDRSLFREVKLVKQIGVSFLFLCMIGCVFFALGSVHHLNILARTITYSVFVSLCVIILRYRFLALQARPETQHMPTPEAAVLPVVPVVATAQPPVVTKAAEEPEIRRSNLTPEEQANVWNQLEVQMKTHRPFTDGALNLDGLAELTGINKYHISETLNAFAQKSFYQYINEYRVAYAIEQMKHLHGKGVTINILSLAYDAGFNAKSSFNRYFKEITNVTPSEYLKSLQQPLSSSDYLSGVGLVVD